MTTVPPAGSGRQRSLGRLALVLMLLAAAVWYQWWPATPAPPTSNLPAGAPRPLQALALPETVRLADLESVSAEADVGRNPFSFGAAPAPAPSQTITAPPVTAPPPPSTVPQGPPPIGLRLTGMLVSPGTDRLMVTLRDPTSGALFHAFEGDVVDGRYRVVKIGGQSVVVSYVDGSGLRTLGLGN